MQQSLADLRLDAFVQRMILWRLAIGTASELPDPKAWVRGFIDTLQSDVEMYCRPEFSPGMTERIAQSIDQFGLGLLAHVSGVEDKCPGAARSEARQ